MASKFCNVCKHILDTRDWEKPRQFGEERPPYQKKPLETHHHLSHLKSTALDCDLCRLILAQIRGRHPWDSLQDKFGEKARLSVGRAHGSTDLVFEIASCELGRLAVYPVQNATQVDGPVDFSPSTGSDSTLDLISTWLSTCRSSHALCNRGTDGLGRLPTRLLDLTPLEGDSASVRLCTDALPRGTEYATLSHCWGPAPITRLTAANLAAFQTRIAVSALCRSFRDAIATARQLGLRYLWIDSLCIVQDCAADWRRESLRMSDIYSRAVLNIAATGAVEGSVGCYFDRDPDLLRTVRLPGRVDGAGDAVLEAGVNRFREDVVRAPLATRGWAFQERILSRRTVHFAQAQVYWDCRELTASEAYPAAMPLNLIPWYWYRDEADSDTELLDLWARYVREYSATNLSHAKDKLIAISGAAKALRKEKGGVYIAGLWWEDMIWQLNWYVWERPLRERPEGRRAPSWSWAAVDGEVVFQGTPPGRTATVDYVATVMGEPDEEYFGEDGLEDLDRGVLKIRCREPLMSMSGSAFAAARSRFDTWCVSMDTNTDHVDDGVVLLSLFVLEYPNSKPLTYGLVLQRVEEKHGAYARLGRFYATPGQFSDLLQREEWRAEDADYEDVVVDENEAGKKKSYVLSLV